MTKHKVGISLSLVLLSLVWLWLSTRPVSAPAAELIPMTHYRLADVQDGVSRFPPHESQKSKPTIRAGVVSHHLLAQQEIARYFQNLSLSRYRRVIMLGPNHGELGNDLFITTRAAWETPYGPVSADTLPALPEHREVMAADHALEVLMPFVKIYLPEARVIPVLVSGKAKLTDIQSLAEKLRPLLTEDTLVLVSTDFSHYLLPSAARANDEVTLRLLERRDLSAIARLGNAYLDSPVAVLTMLILFPQTDIQVFGHTHAGAISGDVHAATTSYYFLNIYAKD